MTGRICSRGERDGGGGGRWAQPLQTGKGERGNKGRTEGKKEEKGRQRVARSQNKTAFPSDVSLSGKGRVGEKRRKMGKNRGGRREEVTTGKEKQERGA